MEDLGLWAEPQHYPVASQWYPQLPPSAPATLCLCLLAVGMTCTFVTPGQPIEPCLSPNPLLKYGQTKAKTPRNILLSVKLKHVTTVQHKEQAALMWPGMGSTPLNARWVGIHAQPHSSTKGWEQLLSSNPTQSSHQQHQAQSSSRHPGMWVLGMEGISLWSWCCTPQTSAWS